jgi:hypothetical protein
MFAQSYNPSYSRGRGFDDHCPRPKKKKPRKLLPMSIYLMFSSKFSSLKVSNLSRPQGLMLMILATGETEFGSMVV